MKTLLPLALAFLCVVVTSTYLPAQDATAKPIRVALYDDAGSTGKGVPRVTELLGKDAAFKLTIFKGSEIASGVLKGYDVVIFTGGSGSKQAAGLGEAGKAEVRKFVENGGGYVGICAGAYLACSGFDWSLGVLDARTVSNKWKRGIGDVKIEVATTAPAITGIQAGEQTVRYANGPIIKPAGRDDVPDYEALATFRTELSENESPKGVMVNSPAWARGTFGKGRVIVSSPHPEQTAGMEPFVASAVKWAAGK